jgi:hypothetical protein
MPNLKIFVDEAIGIQAKARLHAALPALRDLLCRELEVDLALAQFALVPVLGLSDQAMLAVEIQILPKPQRTRENLMATCQLLRETLRAIVDVKTAIRVTTVDPANYLVVR